MKYVTFTFRKMSVTKVGSRSFLPLISLYSCDPFLQLLLFGFNQTERHTAFLYPVSAANCITTMKHFQD